MLMAIFAATRTLVKSARAREGRRRSRQQHAAAAARGDVSAIERGHDFLALDGRKGEGGKRIVLWRDERGRPVEAERVGGAKLRLTMTGKSVIIGSLHHT